MNEPATDSYLNSIAIIGMAGRFPGASDVEALWKVSTQPGDTLRRFTVDELRSEEPDPDAVEHSESYVRVRGILENVEDFDAEFFGVSPGDAALLDPQHRLWLEVAWHALEAAGYAHDGHGQVVGVYAGTFPSTYLHHCLLQSRADVEEFVRMRRARSFAQMINNDPAFLPTRTANRFNLRGPAVNVQTACSTSLVAIGMGVQSLLSYESDIVLAGGVCVAIPQKTGYFYQEGAIFSRDGTCRPYDARACGTVFGNGGAAIVMRRLKDALDAGDHVLATIRGVAINNDGSNKVSYVAPSVRGQAEAIVAALEFSNVDADSIGYVEGHGTATPMGDPIEVEALCAAYRETTSKKGYCCLGSVKGSVGHLDAAAGVTGVIRAVQALRYRTLPSTSHFVEPNPELRLSETPFYVLSAPRPWDTPSGHPRRAAVSSFGIGGTNAHAILEEAPNQEPPVRGQPTNSTALLLSAVTPAALEALTADLREWFERNDPTKPGPSSFEDVAFTLAHRRRHFPHRRAVHASDWSDATRALGDRARWDMGYAADSQRQIVFAFPGQGSLRPGAVSGILRHSPDFAEELATYCAESAPFVDLDLYSWFTNPNAQLASLTSGRPALQLAVFCLSAALAAWLARRGIFPAACVGHSLGEWTAAHVAGVYSRTDAIRAIAYRDQRMHATGPGAGLVVSAAAEEVEPHLSGDTWLACFNSPTHCMISGRRDSVLAAERVLTSRGLKCRLTDIDVAVHSKYMDPAVLKFREDVAEIAKSPPSIPLISTVTGDRMTDEQSMSSDYWATQIRKPVRFDLACRTVLEDHSPALLIELGVGTALRFLFGVMSEAAAGSDAISIPGRLPDSSASYDSNCLSRAELALWAHGLALPESLVPSSGCVAFGLPAYPFQRKRYWVEPPSLESRSQVASPSDCVQLGADRLVPGRQRSVLESILDIVCQLSRLEISTIEPSKSFHDQGFDSLFLVQLAERISTEFGVNVGLRVLMDHPSIERISVEIDARLAGKPAARPVAQRRIDLSGKQVTFRGLHVVQQGDDQLPLFLVHGDVLLDSLPKYLEPGQTIVGYMHQGADGDEIKLTSVEALAHNCLAEWVSKYGSRPLVVGGHSYGGLIAFHLCHEFAKLGIEVPLLVLLDTQHPSVFHPNPLANIRALGRWRYRMAELLESYDDLRRAKRLLKSTGRVPFEMRTKYTMATYDLAIRDYRPPVVECDALLFRADVNYSNLPNNAWPAGIRGRIDVVPVPGNHISVVRDPEDIDIVGKELGQRMARLRHSFMELDAAAASSRIG